VKLEQLIQAKPGYFELRETAGIHQLYRLDKADSMCFLKKHYLSQGQEMAA